MTIQELLVRDGVWPTPEGPYIDRRFVVFKLPIDTSVKGEWQYTMMSTYVYVPRDDKDLYKATTAEDLIMRSV